jgi:hypothetical protein
MNRGREEERGREERRGEERRGEEMDRCPHTPMRCSTMPHDIL